MLKRRRKAKRLTQAALAQLVGVSQAYIAKLESGAKTNPTLDLLTKLAQALDVSVLRLFR